MGDSIDHTTPELALVDPVLAARARARLPPPGDCLAPQRRSISEITAATSLVRPSLPQTLERAHAVERGRVLDRVAVVGAWLLVLVIVGSSLLAFVPQSSSSRPEVMAVDSAPAAREPVTPRQDRTVTPVRSGAAGASEAIAIAREDGGIWIRWPSDDRASFYNVILLRSGTRIDLWPTVNSATYMTPHDIWVAQRAQGIRYRWYVYPGYRSGAAIDFGSALAQGVVVAGGVRRP